MSLCFFYRHCVEGEDHICQGRSRGTPLGPGLVCSTTYRLFVNAGVYFLFEVFRVSLEMINGNINMCLATVTTISWIMAHMHSLVLYVMSKDCCDWKIYKCCHLQFPHSYAENQKLTFLVWENVQFK